MKLVAMAGIAGLTLAVGAASPAMATPYAFTQLPFTAGGLNDAGQVAGVAPIPSDPGVSGLALYDHGAVTLLGFGPVASGSQFVGVSGLNDSGLIIGGSSPPHFTFAFAYQDGVPFSLAEAGSFNVILSGVNNKGEIIGLLDGNRAGGPILAFVLSNGIVTRLPVPDPLPGGFLISSIYAAGINDLEQIVGHYSQDRDPLSSRALSTGFLLSGGVYSPIAVPGAAETYAIAINDNGEVVGTYSDTAGIQPQHGFEEKNGVFSTIVGPGGGDFLPTGLNNSGQIIGFQVTSRYPNDYYRTDYLGTPQDVPEPSSLALLCAGLTGLLGWRAQGRRGQHPALTSKGLPLMPRDSRSG